jgi:hypothetical protein
MLNNFLKARAGEKLGAIKFMADLRKSGKDLILERVISRKEIVSFNVVVLKALQLAFSRHLSDD